MFLKISTITLVFGLAIPVMAEIKPCVKDCVPLTEFDDDIWSAYLASEPDTSTLLGNGADVSFMYREKIGWEILNRPVVKDTLIQLTDKIYPQDVAEAAWERLKEEFLTIHPDPKIVRNIHYWAKSLAIKYVWESYPHTNDMLTDLIFEAEYGENPINDEAKHIAQLAGDELLGRQDLSKSDLEEVVMFASEISQCQKALDRLIRSNPVDVVGVLRYNGYGSAFKRLEMAKYIREHFLVDRSLDFRLLKTYELFELMR